MAFCKLSSEFNNNSFTQIENNFIKEFLPNINPLALKVYLYGLYLCQNGIDHTIEDFEKTFNLSEDDIVSLFKCLEELNLVDCLELNPIEIRYLPVKNSSMYLKKYDVNKFKTFNAKSQNLLKRQIDINEYNQYYYQIEKNHLDEDMVVKCIEYCVAKKGDSVSANYILTVLRNWAMEGIKTEEEADARIVMEERYSDDIKLILTTLGVKRACTLEEKTMFLDWTTNLEFGLDALIHLAKITKSKKGNMAKLNALVNRCYELGKFSAKEIDDYFSMEEEYYNIAKTVCRNLGLHYDNLSIVVETFISKWCNLGYDLDALSKLSLYCLKSDIRSLQGLDNTVNKMFKLGVITAEAIDIYLKEQNCFDDKIEEIIKSFGLNRNVNRYDRSYYNTWINDWNTPTDVLNYAIDLSKDKLQPMQFLNRVLSIYHIKNITTVEQAKKEKLDFENTYKQKSNNPKQIEKHDYTKEQLSSLFDTITEVEL